MPEQSDDELVYYITKRVCRLSGGSLIVGVPNEFFMYDDLLQLTLWDITDPSRKIMTTKRVGKRTGRTKCVYLNREWGFKEGDIIVMRIKRLPGDSCVTAEEDG